MHSRRIFRGCDAMAIAAEISRRLSRSRVQTSERKLAETPDAPDPESRQDSES
jgi:hypothetical protein